MSLPEIEVIAAMDRKQGIGKDGKIPWRGRIPEDMAHFRDVTIGFPVVMGRVTWESIPLKFRPLPDRTNVVITRAADFEVEGIEIAHSIEEAIQIASRVNSKVFIMGGAQIYAQTLSFADRLNLTLVEGDFDCDAFFPDYSGFGMIAKTEPNENDWFTSERGLKYRFLTVVRDNSTY